jgi:hypothetical protein
MSFDIAKQWKQKLAQYGIVLYVDLETYAYFFEKSHTSSKAESLPSKINTEVRRTDVGPGQQGENPGGGTPLGGINFTALPIITQPNGTWSFNLPPQQIQGLASLNLAEESIQINNLITAGITPSFERIKDLCLAFYVQHDLRNGKDTVLSCIRDTLRLQEGSLVVTEAEYRELLIFLESTK